MMTSGGGAKYKGSMDCFTQVIVINIAVQVEGRGLFHNCTVRQCSIVSNKPIVHTY